MKHQHIYIAPRSKSRSAYSINIYHQDINEFTKTPSIKSLFIRKLEMSKLVTEESCSFQEHLNSENLFDSLFGNCSICPGATRNQPRRPAPSLAQVPVLVPPLTPIPIIRNPQKHKTIRKHYETRRRISGER